MTTESHYFIDVIGGIALAGVSIQLAKIAMEFRFLEQAQNGWLRLGRRVRGRQLCGGLLAADEPGEDGEVGVSAEVDGEHRG